MINQDERKYHEADKEPNLHPRMMQDQESGISKDEIVTNY
jgi:hypothetical protein